MKNLLYTLSILFLFSSCASIDRLARKGKYEQAFALGIKKLSRKKNKKTKHVKGLEIAFKKLNDRDLNSVSNILEISDTKEWYRVYRIYNSIYNRQELLKPLLPLISKEGYIAHFDFINGLTKSHVKTMELRFGRLNNRDFREISTIISSTNSKLWNKIFKIYNRIDRRQGAIEQLPKIVSEDGYQAKFKFVKKGFLLKKHVKAIETAFKRLNTSDLNHVDNLKAKDNPKYWEEILSIYRRINSRQKLLAVRLPIRSEDGYKAVFKFIKTGSLEKQATINSANYLYDKAMSYMQSARSGNKNRALQAYNTFNKVSKFITNYKDVTELVEEAYNLGQTRILVSFANKSRSIIPRRFASNLLGFNIQKLNSKWIKFYNSIDKSMNYDITATYVLDFVDASPEREIIKHVIETKEVSNGWEYVFDENGNVLKDTLGNDIKEERFKILSADVAHVIMEKSIGIDGRFVIKNIKSGQIILDKPVRGRAVFDEHFSRFNGDINALSEETKRKLRKGSINFPSHEELLLPISFDLKLDIVRELERLF